MVKWRSSGSRNCDEVGDGTGCEERAFEDRVGGELGLEANARGWDLVAFYVYHARAEM